MSLPFALVVTINWEPLGEKATCPGVLVNCGVAAAFRPRARPEPGSGTRRSKATTYPWTVPPFSALRT
jgi:hypothetical protein